ncbi:MULTISPECIES: hypothetical protein [unclassified Bradyrhizobium]|uniref:hypothetical protein n=1 Tax=unclassified Bradyrhizobium TaxID=2631580 RepID=UPI001CD52F26|nr:MULTISPECIES: hypothetical protein [unclassified Bradyrhizobium]
MQMDVKELTASPRRPAAVPLVTMATPAGQIAHGLTELCRSDRRHFKLVAHDLPPDLYPIPTFIRIGRPLIRYPVSELRDEQAQVELGYDFDVLWIS